MFYCPAYPVMNFPYAVLQSYSAVCRDVKTLFVAHAISQTCHKHNKRQLLQNSVARRCICFFIAWLQSGLLSFTDASVESCIIRCINRASHVQSVVIWRLTSRQKSIQWYQAIQPLQPAMDTAYPANLLLLYASGTNQTGRESTATQRQTLYFKPYLTVTAFLSSYHAVWYKAAHQARTTQPQPPAVWESKIPCRTRASRPTDQSGKQ